MGRQDRLAVKDGQETVDKRGKGKETFCYE